MARQGMLISITDLTVGVNPSNCSVSTLHIGMFVFKLISYQGTCFKLYAVSKCDIHNMKNSRVINIGILVPRMLLEIGALIASPNIKILDMAKAQALLLTLYT